MSDKTRHPQPAGAKDPSHPHPGARMPKTPDKATLGWATLFAAFLAAVVLVLFVLPAEHGIDPTNFGRITGIADLHSDSNEIDLGGGNGTVHRDEPAPPRNVTVTFTLAGLGEDEYKLHLDAGQGFVYSWTATGAVNFDFHGEPDEPSRPGEFASYEDGQGDAGSGSFQAPFTGRHGWYFQNVGDAPVTITIEAWGYFEVVGLVG